MRKVPESDLEKIKQSAILYLKKEKPLNWEVHVAELERGAILDFDEGQRIGRWAVTMEEDSIVLIRDADMAPEVRRFGIIFKKRNGEFVVAEDFWERESFE